MFPLNNNMNLRHISSYKQKAVTKTMVTEHISTLKSL